MPERVNLKGLFSRVSNPHEINMIYSKKPAPKCSLLASAGVFLIIQFVASSAIFASDSAENNTVSVSLKNNELPASDLIFIDHGVRRILSPEEAWQLQSKNNVDLSRLEPDSNNDLIADNTTPSGEVIDNSLDINSEDRVNYHGLISSSAGRFRFNVQTATSGHTSETLTLMIAKNLHTFLLRKELLRKLGYRIPAMKYLPKVTVHFPDVATRDFILNTQIPAATFGAAARWVGPASTPTPASTPQSTGATGSLDVIFQDVVAMEATPLYFNLALGPPIDITPDTNTFKPEGPRILRSLAIPYGLAAIPESLNQANWYVGRKQGDSIVFDVPDEADFSCTLNDALWMLRRMATLTRDDYSKIVEESFWPEAVGNVLLEKLISRRNDLVSLFGVDASPIEVNNEITDGELVKNGKVIQQDWPGFASRFAWGDPDSPLGDMQYYGYSQAEGNILDNLISAANKALPSLTEAKQLAKHQENLIQSGLEKYLSTGVAQKVGFGVWFAPLVSGGVTLSRDIILGQYMGTDNLVQLADTFGLHASAGLLVGVDIPTGLPVMFQVSGVFGGTVSINLTHLKPLSNLKSAVTEPLQNTIVPWLAYRASGVLGEVGDLKNGNSQDPDQIKKALAEDLDQLRDYLGVGESLILTQSLSAAETVSVGVQAPVPISPTASIDVGANELILSRLHFYRKDANTIMVFKDNGQLTGVSFSFSISFGLPVSFQVLSFTAKSVSGSADSKIFTLNIDPDPSANPGVFEAAAALAAALRNSSTEILEAQQKPTDLSIVFKDQATGFNFFTYVNRSLKTNGNVKISLPDGSSESFVSMTDGNQYGQSYQALANEAANYIIQRITGNANIAVNTNPASDPGQTLLGHSVTRDVQLQGRTDSGLTDLFIKIKYKWEGWNISADDTIKFAENLSKKLAFQLYPAGFMADTKNVQLYDIELSINVYQAALAKVLQMSADDQLALDEKYRPQLCKPFGFLATIFAFIKQVLGLEDPLDPSTSEVMSCGALNDFVDSFADYRNASDDSPSNIIEKASRGMKVVSALERFTTLDDLVQLVGGPDHIYVSSSISGFRVGSETLSDPIKSNTLGRQDRANPEGVLSSAQQIMGVDNGEFKMQWLRDKL